MRQTVSTDEQKIGALLTRGVERVYPSLDALRERLRSGKRLTIYHGIDPTGPTLHLGHSVILRKLGQFQSLGHQVILLIGDFTAMIGDPTDKLATRKRQTREQVLKNSRLYREQASRFLLFEGENSAILRFNREWLSALTLTDIIELSAHFTVQQMAERDMFKQRMQDGKPVYLHEFLYPLMQGYDSIAMDVDGEIGGNDQTFNMLAGRDLLRELKQKDKFVLSMKLLTDPSGKKMGKTEGNVVAMTDAPEDMYGKVMSWTDEMIEPAFSLCTDIPGEELERVRSRLVAGENPMTLKQELAKAIVTALVGDAVAAKAEQYFQSVHQEGKQPKEIPTIFSEEHELSLADALVLAGLVSSKTEARRQIEQAAVKVNEETQRDVNARVIVTEEGVVLQKGKRYFVRIKRCD